MNTLLSIIKTKLARKPYVYPDGMLAIPDPEPQVSFFGYPEGMDKIYGPEAMAKLKKRQRGELIATLICVALWLLILTPVGPMLISGVCWALGIDFGMWAKH